MTQFAPFAFCDTVFKSERGQQGVHIQIVMIKDLGVFIQQVLECII